jgi:hypothetical protein
VELKGIGTEGCGRWCRGWRPRARLRPCPKPVQAMVPHGWRVPQEMDAR